MESENRTRDYLEGRLLDLQYGLDTHRILEKNYLIDLNIAVELKEYKRARELIEKLEANDQVIKFGEKMIRQTLNQIEADKISGIY